MPPVKSPEDRDTKGRQRVALVCFLLLAVLMYGSIMYKIMHYGP